MADLPHVVVVGAGFAGVGTLRKLEGKHVHVTLIDRNDYHTFLPLLYQVATNQLSRDEVGFPALDLLKGEGREFIQAEVSGFDLDARTVQLQGQPDVAYDYLVIGLGGVVNYFGTQGAAENALPLYSMADALKLREHIIGRLQAASNDPSLVEDGALRFVVVGGGATGVEISGAIAELLTADLKKDFPGLPSEAPEIHLYEMAPQLLTPFKPVLQHYARSALEQRGVQVHVEEGVASIEPTRVHLKSGAEVKAHTLVWGAGLAASPLASQLGQQLVRGRVATQPDLSLPGHPEVFVAGDIALITDSKTQKQLPQLGSVAQQAGFRAGENIARLVEGKQTQPFEYKDKGTMATIGRGAAIVELKSGRTMTGRAAWLAWLGVHLMLLSGGEQRAHTLVDWGWDTLHGDRSKGLLDDSEDDLAA